MLLIYTAVSPVGISAMQTSELHSIIKENYIELLALFPAVTLLLLLAFLVHINRYIRLELRKTMQLIVVVVFSLVVQNFLEYRLADGELRWLARTLTAIYGYAIRPVILVLFLKVIAPQKRFGWAWALVGINAAVNLTALFSHICFWIDEGNHWQGGPLNKMCYYVSVILLVCWFVLTIRIFQPQKRKETWVPVLVFALIFCSIVMDDNIGSVAQPVTFLTLAIVIGCMAYYVWLHMQFVREHEQALMAEQRIQIMMSQIQPHFLFNSLEVIRGLYRKDPAQADAALLKFERYLRGNMESLTQDSLVPFEKELAHTKLYLDLELLRFPDELHVKYELDSTDFLIPPLTLQPLVENAVRHGIRGKKSGEGTVSISTRRFADRYEISVADDGPGFDPETLPQDGVPHIGLANVRERLKYAGASLRLDSRPGRGT